ncbi:choice-of-anchor L domain-containing protein [Halocola ammonii]
MRSTTIKFIVASLAIFSFLTSSAQIDVDNTLTVEEYVTQFLIGEGVEVSNITFNGMPGDQVSVYVGSFQNASDEITLEEGMIMASGGVTVALGPNESGSSSGPGTTNYNDSDLEQAANSTNLNDEAVVEFDFVPQGDSIKFNYVWASEEYPEFVNSYNDIFGFFLSGPGINGPYSNNAENIAIVPGTNLPVSINNINNGNDGVSGPCVNCEYYVDNNYDFGGGPTPYNIQFDGFTVPLQASAEVQCGETYHIKLAIADAIDTGFDSAIFLENNSFTSPEIINVVLGTGVDGDNTVYETCPPSELIFSRAEGGGDDWVEIVYGGNAEAGVDYAELPDSLFFAEGTNEIILDLEIFEDDVVEGLDSLTMSVLNYVECTDDFIETNFTIFIQDELEGEIVEDDFILGSCSETFTLTSDVYAGRPEILYEWVDDNGNVLSTDPTLTTQLDQETTYTLTLSDQCDTEVVDEVTVTPGDLPVIDNMPNTVDVTCVDTTSFFPEVSGGLGEYTYSWLVDGAEQSSDTTFTINVSDTTNITLIVTDECNAADTVTTVLEYQPTPINIDIGEDVDASCVDQTVLFPDIEGGEVPYSYLWHVDTLVYDSTAQITVQSYETVQVTLFMEEACGYTAQDSMIINIPDNPMDITPVEDTLICEGTPATLSAIAEGGEGGFEYFWSPSGLVGQQVEVWPDGPTIYEVTAVDICEDSISAEVEVDIDYVQATIDRQLLTDTEIQFAGGTVPECENCTYEWNFGDGGSSLSQDPIHEFDGLQEYVTELTVTTEIGCVSSTTINIDPPVSIYIPNAFSPNGDGINEYFQVESQGVKKFEMYIFNRWGDVVFQTGNPKDRWLGEVNDGDHYALNNIYTYVITYEGVNEVEETRTGTITIIR